MNEKKKTYIFMGVAVVLLLIAFISQPGPVRPDAFLDQGEPFFPEFEDPNTAAVMEVVDFNEETGEAVPFKVEFKEGLWRIPSHYDYPADGKDHLAKTAAGVIGIKKDDFRSDNAADHEACGVIDPLDETATSMTGRGKRITLKAENDKVLADFIVGKKVEGREGFRFVRVPDQKRVYAVRMDINISTKFSDWIEKDLLLTDKDKIDNITIKDYSVNERTGSVNNRDVLVLSKKDEQWTANKMPSSKEVDTKKMDELLKAIDELSIVDIRLKPEGISASLSKSGNVELTQETAISLQNKGYYFTREGQLLSNEGEVEVATSEGVIYTLRFGEVVYGEAEVDNEADKGDPVANRYLFITARFDDQKFSEPQQPANMDFQGKADSLLTTADKRNKKLFEDHESWNQKVENGQQLTRDLNDRFAKWYYIISSDSFDKINLKRKDLVVAKKND